MPFIFRHLKICMAACLVIGTTAAMAKDSNASKNLRTEDEREGALDSYVNTSTDDRMALLRHIQQELYVNQQKMIEIEFRQQYQDRISLKNIYYNSSGELIPGHVFQPAELDQGRIYPAVVMVHGGYHERLDASWFPLIETLVDNGFVVIFPEYRGSRGYGPEIYKNDYGTTDVADVLAAAEYLQGLPFIDSNRLGIYGESRGGMVTLLAIERAPQLFKAAVDVVGLADFVAYMSYKPEYRRREIAEDNAGFEGKSPNENLPRYIDVSPINHVEKIESPLLVIATTGDKIVPISLHTGRLLDLLRAKGKVHEAKIYDDAPGGHIFMRGQSSERSDATKRIVKWYRRYLKGQLE